jgi:hypothetical protein
MAGLGPIRGNCGVDGRRVKRSQRRVGRVQAKCQGGCEGGERSRAWRGVCDLGTFAWYVGDTMTVLGRVSCKVGMITEEMFTTLRCWPIF